MDRRCLVDLELRIDGKIADFDGQIVVPPGAHEVTVEVVRNDPRNVRYSLVIWKERP